MSWPGEKQTSALNGGGTQRFEIQLSDEKETIINFRKLLKAESSRPSSEAPEVAAEAAASILGPGQGVDKAAAKVKDALEKEDALPPPANRFDSVIARIESLYKRQGSDDEGGSARASDTASENSYYDTDDSFIDDNDLNEYFEPKGRPQRAGFYVNRGELAVDKDSIPQPRARPKKRRKRPVPDESKSAVGKEAVKRPLQVNKKLRLTDEGVLGDPSKKQHKDRSVVLTKAKIKKSGTPDGSVKVASQSERPKEGSSAQRMEGNASLQFSHRNLLPGSGEKVEPDAKQAGEAVGAAQGQDVQKQGTGSMPKDVASRQEGVAVPVSRDEDLPAGVVVTGSQDHDRSNLGGAAIASAVRKKDGAEVEEFSIKKRASGGSHRAQGTTAAQAKDGPIGKNLEKAIGELERAHAEYLERCAHKASKDGGGQEQKAGGGVTSPSGEGGDKGHGSGKRFRLPKALHEKLAKVARLSTKKGRVHEGVFERLKGFMSGNHTTLRINLKKLAAQDNPPPASEEGSQRPDTVKLEPYETSSLPSAAAPSNLGNGTGGAEKRPTAAGKAGEKSGDEDEGPSEAALQVLHKLKELVSARLAQQARAQPAEKGPDSIGEAGASTFQWDRETEDLACKYANMRTKGLAVKNGKRARQVYIELEGLWPNGEVDKEQLMGVLRRVRSRQLAKKKRQLERSSAAAKLEGPGSGGVTNSHVLEAKPSALALNMEAGDKEEPGSSQHPGAPSRLNLTQEQVDLASGAEKTVNGKYRVTGTVSGSAAENDSNAGPSKQGGEDEPKRKGGATSSIVPESCSAEEEGTTAQQGPAMKKARVKEEGTKTVKRKPLLKKDSSKKKLLLIKPSKKRRKSAAPMKVVKCDKTESTEKRVEPIVVGESVL